jgi:hypothetical protein
MTRQTTIRAAAHLVGWVALLLQATRRVTLIVAVLAVTLAPAACSPVAVTGPDLPGGLLDAETDTDDADAGDQDVGDAPGEDAPRGGDADEPGWHEENADLPAWVDGPPKGGRRLPAPNDCYNASPPNPC